jgi:hypothetical protein
LEHFHGTVVVAVPVVGMVEVSAHQVVRVAAVRDRFVPASWPMNVLRAVAGTGVLRRTRVGVVGGDLQRAFVEMVAVQRVHAAVVQVIDVRAVPDGRVPAPFAVHVRVVAVDLVFIHHLFFFHTLPGMGSAKI